MIKQRDSIEVVCDSCGDKRTFIGYLPATVGSALRNNGWRSVDGEHLCPKCTKGNNSEMNVAPYILMIGGLLLMAVSLWYKYQ